MRSWNLPFPSTPAVCYSLWTYAGCKLAGCVSALKLCGGNLFGFRARIFLPHVFLKQPQIGCVKPNRKNSQPPTQENNQQLCGFARYFADRLIFVFSVNQERTGYAFRYLFHVTT
jgi:hypothetical protein